jgi:hypothetical protein
MFCHLTLALLIAAGSSCKNQDSSPNNPSPSLQQPLSLNDNPILSSEPQENVSIDDYWDEARSIKEEAYQIIHRAKAVRCEEARQHALKAIAISTETEGSKNLEEAEHLTGKASDAIIHAEDALTYCEEKSDIPFPVQTSYSTQK